MSQPTEQDALTRQRALAEAALAGEPDAATLAERVADYVCAVRAVRLAGLPTTQRLLTTAANHAAAVLGRYADGPVGVYADGADSWRADVRDWLAAALRDLLRATPEAPPAEPAVDITAEMVAQVLREWHLGSTDLDYIAGAEMVMSALRALPVGDRDLGDDALMARLREVVAAVGPVPPGFVQAAKDVFGTHVPTPRHMDRRHPDGAVVGDPVPAGMTASDAAWDNRCPRRMSVNALSAHRCDRPTGHAGQHLAVGPTNGDGTGDLVVVAVWPAGTGWTSA